MKVAIFQPYIDNVGGAEKVALYLAKELNADIYTTNINKEAIIKMGFLDILPRIYSIGEIPLEAPAKQIAVLYRFRKLILKNKYDCFILNGDWVLSSVIKNQPAVYYANNAPCREAFDLREFIRKGIESAHNRLIFDIWTSTIRFLFKNYIKKCKKIVVNSMHVKNEFLKNFEREVSMIHPPTETNNFYYKKPEDYWLLVSRINPHKRIEIAISAFSRLPRERLKIVGWGENTPSYKEYLKKINDKKPSNVEIMDAVEKEKLLEIYARCKGVISTTIREDFGLVPIEAMASGKPVIAPNEGGFKETIVNGKTGVLIDNITEDNLAEAVKKLSPEIKKNPLKYKKACQNQAKKFDLMVFINQIKEIINDTSL